MPEPVRLASSVGATTSTLEKTLSMFPVLSLLPAAQVMRTRFRVASFGEVVWPRMVIGPERVMFTCSV